MTSYFCIEILSDIDEEEIKKTGIYFSKLQGYKNIIYIIESSFSCEYSMFNGEEHIISSDFSNKRLYISKIKSGKYVCSDKYVIIDDDIINAINIYSNFSDILISKQEFSEKESYVKNKKITAINFVKNNTFLLDNTHYLIKKYS